MTISLKRQEQFDQDEMDLSAVGAKIRALRQTVGYSIEDLAVTCGLTSTEIMGVEEGLEADSGQLKRIASALQVSLSDLLNGQE